MGRSDRGNRPTLTEIRTWYRVSDVAVDHWTRHLSRHSAPVAAHKSYLIGLQAAAVMRIAQEHRRGCRPPAGCRTCLEIADAIAMLAAAQRIADRDEFRRITREL